MRKLFENQVLLQKSHQSEKHPRSPYCKMLRNILKMNKGGTNQPKKKKIDDYVEGLTFER